MLVDQHESPQKCSAKVNAVNVEAKGCCRRTSLAKVFGKAFYRPRDVSSKKDCLEELRCFAGGFFCNKVGGGGRGVLDTHDPAAKWTV